MCAQLTHSAGESGPASPGTYAVVLSAESEQELERIAARLEQHDVPVHRVVEGSGRYSGQLMALGVPPGPKSQRGKHLSNLPLLRFTDLDEYHEFQQDCWACKKQHRREIRETKATWIQKLKKWWSARHQPKGG
jgi:hypothetical protein